MKKIFTIFLTLCMCFAAIAQSTITELVPNFNVRAFYNNNRPPGSPVSEALSTDPGGVAKIITRGKYLYLSMNPYSNAPANKTGAMVARYVSGGSTFTGAAYFLEDMPLNIQYYNQHIVASSSDIVFPTHWDTNKLYRVNVNNWQAAEQVFKLFDPSTGRYYLIPHTTIPYTDDNNIMCSFNASKTYPDTTINYTTSRPMMLAKDQLDGPFTLQYADSSTTCLNDTVYGVYPFQFNGRYHSVATTLRRIPGCAMAYAQFGALHAIKNNNVLGEWDHKLQNLKFKDITQVVYGMENQPVIVKGKLAVQLLNHADTLLLIDKNYNMQKIKMPHPTQSVAMHTEGNGQFFYIGSNNILYGTDDFIKWDTLVDFKTLGWDPRSITYWPYRNCLLAARFAGDWQVYKISLNKKVSTHQESFENKPQLWESTGTLDWHLRHDAARKRSTNNTGPAGASDGQFYRYINCGPAFGAPGSEGLAPEASAILESPVVDISGLAVKEWSFDYHMWGTNVGTLRAEISTNDGATWQSLWSLSGNQGDVWRRQTVSLTAWSLQTGARLRLRATMPSGIEGTSDMGVDNIALGNVFGGTGKTMPEQIVKQERSASFYPNPFSKTTNIQYDLNEEGDTRVDITIRSSKGELVYRKSIGKQQGAISFSWSGMDNNGRTLPNGIYFVNFSKRGETKDTYPVILQR